MIDLQTYSERISIHVSDIQSKSRKREFVTARQVYGFYLRQNGYCFREISEMLNIDHSTIYAGIRKVYELINLKDKYLSRFLNAIEL